MDTQELRDELRDLNDALRQEMLESALQSRPVSMEVVRYVSTRKKEVNEILASLEKTEEQTLWTKIATRYGTRHWFHSYRATEEAMEMAGWREKFQYLWNNGVDTLEEMEQLLFYK